MILSFAKRSVTDKLLPEPQLESPASVIERATAKLEEKLKS
jgi:hypothetical protein